jgi:hypothetical protein
MSVVTPSDIYKFVARKNNKIIQVMQELESPFMSSLSREDAKGSVYKINVTPPASGGVGFVADNGATRSGESRTPVQGEVAPCAISGKLEIGHITLNTFTGADDSANYLVGEMESISKTMAQQAGGSLFAPAGQLNTISALGNFSGGQGTFTVDNASMLSVGAVVEVMAGNDKAFLVRIGQIVLNSSDLTAVVTCFNDVAGAHANNTDANINTAFGDLVALTHPVGMYQPGTWDVVGTNGAASASLALGPTPLSTLAGTGTVYGLSAANIAKTHFIGRLVNLGAVPSHANLGAHIAHNSALTGQYPNLIVVNPLVATILGYGASTAAGQVGSWNPSGGVGGLSRRMNDGKLDLLPGTVGKSIKVEVSGIPVMADRNCGPSTAYAVDTKCLKLLEWKKAGPLFQASDAAANKSNEFGVEVQFAHIFNFACDKRSSILGFTGLTSDVL